MGTAGQMLSPMHLCILVTVEYFKSNFLRSLAPVAVMEAVMVIIVAIRYGMF